MINVLKLLAVTVTVSLPSALMAQQSGDITAPFGHTGKHFNDSSKREITLFSEPLNDSIGEMPFVNHLPKIVPNGKRNLRIFPSQPNTGYDSNMPIVQPGVTTDIPVRKLDAKSPYIYNMPIKKSVVVRKQ